LFVIYYGDLEHRRTRKRDRSEDTQVNSNKDNLKNTGATPKLMTFNTSHTSHKIKKGKTSGN